MAFGEDFLTGFFTGDNLKDYRHASKTFVADSYALAPRQKYLFHTFFNINTTEIPRLKMDKGGFLSGNTSSSYDKSVVGLLAKSVQLPRFNIDTEIKNQYNRKRIVQTKINYEPIEVVFHDDGSDIVRNMWYNYFSYYYKDPSQQYRNPASDNGSSGQTGDANGTGRFSYNARDIYTAGRTQNDWGYVGESYSDSNGTGITGGKPAFFRDITVFGFNQSTFAMYVYINPMIRLWEHDTYDYDEDAGIMEHRMQIDYETVKYYSGRWNSPARNISNVPGFAVEAYYDKVASSLVKGGATSILGTGGLVDQIGGIISDLQSGSVAGIIGAIQRAGTTYGTFKGKDLKSIISNESKDVFQDIVRGELPGAIKAGTDYLDSYIFPTPKINNRTDITPATPREE